MKKNIYFVQSRYRGQLVPSNSKLLITSVSFKYSVKLLKFNFIYPEVGLSCFLHMKKKSCLCDKSRLM